MSLQGRWLVRVPTASPQEPPLHDTESGLCVASRVWRGHAHRPHASCCRKARRVRGTMDACVVWGMGPHANRIVLPVPVCSAAVATAKQMTMWFGTIFGAGGGIQAFRTMPVAYQPPPRQSGW